MSTFVAAAACLFLASVMCHSARGPSQALWQRLDHAAAFLLIAATYTPFALVGPPTALSQVVLAAVWSTALAATFRQLRGGDVEPPLPLYVGLGWFSVAAALPVAARSGTGATLFLLLGAGLYSVGTVFYRNRSGWRHAHGVWHLFVLAASASHYLAIAGLAAG